MQNMEEKEFEKMEKKKEYCERGQHDVVKLYVNGCHTDYGCVLCGMKSLILADFSIKVY